MNLNQIKSVNQFCSLEASNLITSFLLFWLLNFNTLVNELKIL